MKSRWIAIITTGIGGALLGGLVWYFNRCTGGECAKTQWPELWIGGGALIGLYGSWSEKREENDGSI